MKGFFLIFFILFSSLVLYAQDQTGYDTTVAPPAVDYEDQDYEDDEDEEYVEHELVDPDEVVKKTEYKDEKIEVKKFNPEEWRKIVGSTNYEEKPEEVKEEEEAKDQSINIPWANPILQVIGYGVIIAIVIAILYYVLNNIRIDTKVDKRPLTGDDPMNNVEHIDELDVNQLLQKTLAEGNYKLAVRLYFLRLLKRLNETGVIAWKKDKTNRDYLSEIFARKIYFDEVRLLTLAYEQIWYGEHVIPGESYKVLFNEFETVQQKLNTAKES